MVAAGDIVYAADMNAVIAGSIGKPVCQLMQSVAQSIPNGVATALTFTTEVKDTHGIHESVTNPSRVTPNVPGTYRVTATYASAANTATQLAVSVAKNGAVVQPYKRDTPAATSAAKSVQTSALVDCNGTTDYIEAQATQNSGAALNTQVSGGVNSTLEVVFERP
jgi:hypothetical protein